MSNLRENPAHLLMLLAAGTLNGLGQVVMRWGGRMAGEPFAWSNLAGWANSSRWWLVGLMITWGSGLAWALLLRKVSLSTAFPIFVGTSYVFTILGAAVILAEVPRLQQWAGIAIVLAGVLLIVLG